MRTSLNDIRKIEQYANGSGDQGERLITQARLLVSAVWRHNYLLQKKIEQLVRLYSRKKMKEELAQVHERLFSDVRNKEWKEKISQNFNQ